MIDAITMEFQERIMKCWHLNEQTAPLLARAFRAVAHDCNQLNVARTVGIILAYNAVGLVSDTARYRAIEMLEKLERYKRKGDAIYTIRAFFRPLDERKDIRQKLALMTEIDARNAEKLQAAGLISKAPET